MARFVLVSLFALVALAQGAPSIVTFKVDETNTEETLGLFQTWQVKHGKYYSSKDEQMLRYEIFLNNLKKATELNGKRVGKEDAFFGPTKFADLTVEEFRDNILMRSWARGPRDKVQRTNRTTKAPDSFDWTTESGDVVTSIKDQGQQGTCWAFAGCANVESLWARKTGKQSPDLSTEALNDCDGYLDEFQGAVACGPLGATMPGFYLWVIQEGGFMKWEDYPYCVGNGDCRPCQPPGYSEEYCGGEWPISPCNKKESCDANYDKSKFVDGLKVTDFVYFETSETSLQDSLVEVGPLIAGIDAVDMQLYDGGILKPNDCDPDFLNHAVVLVGYGADGGSDFWRAKNSWGTSWGEDGFLRIQRGTGACGVNMDVSSSVLGD